MTNEEVVREILKHVQRIEELLTISDKDVAKELIYEMKRITKKNVEIEELVTDLLYEIGIPKHLKGYHCLREAVVITIEDPTYLDMITKRLYPDVAKKLKTTGSRVERAIRHAIEVAWNCGNLKELKKYLGFTVSPEKGKPSNSEFVALLVDYIQFEIKERSIQFVSQTNLHL